MGEDRITMTKQDLERYQVIQRSLRAEITQAQVAEWLGLCERQVRRLVKKVRQEGLRGLAHRSRGRTSPRKMKPEDEERIGSIIAERYPDFTPLHVSEKLWERHQIRLSREKVRLIMIAQGLWKRRRRRPAEHPWREPKPHLGEMVQLDGSHHAWLEDRGPKLVLMGLVDDATNRYFGRFYDHEGVFPALDVVRRYIERYGLPQSLYLDKHSTYKTTRQPDIDELLRDEPARTQFERAVAAAGIKIIHAHSPQAKGRIERSFGTLQNRLVKEMRLAGLRDIEAANRFLEGYLETFNRRFMKEARQPPDVHRPWLKSLSLDDIFCLQSPRTVNNGCLVKWRGRTFVLLRSTLTMSKQPVIVREWADGRISIRYHGQDLAYKEVEVRRPQPAVRTAAIKTSRRPPKYTPPPSHPWKRTPFTQLPG